MKKILFLLMLSLSVNFLYAQHEGVLTKKNVQIGKCFCETVNVKYNVYHFWGSPLWNGTYEATGASDCSLPLATIWLKIANGGTYGYIRLSPTTPKMNKGHGFNISSSSTWDDFICDYQGDKKINCLSEASAKNLYTNGKIVDFVILVGGIVENERQDSNKGDTKDKHNQNLANPKQEVIDSKIEKINRKKQENSNTLDIINNSQDVFNFIFDTFQNNRIERIKQDNLYARDRAFEELNKKAQTENGELTECLNCFGQGHQSCRNCGSTGKVICNVCKGAGGQLCNSCNGAGTNIWGHTCLSCFKTGIMKCSNCGNNGQTICTYCYGLGESQCQYCNGTGLNFIKNDR